MVILTVARIQGKWQYISGSFREKIKFVYKLPDFGEIFLVHCMWQIKKKSQQKFQSVINIYYSYHLYKLVKTGTV